MNDSLFDYWDFRSECFSAHKKIVASLTPTVPFQRALHDVFQTVLAKLGYFLSLNSGAHILVNPNRHIGPHSCGLCHVLKNGDNAYQEIAFSCPDVRTGISELDRGFWEKAEQFFSSMPLVKATDALVEGGVFLPSPMPKEVTLIRFASLHDGQMFNLGFCALWNDPRKPLIRGPRVDSEHLEAWIREVQGMLIEQMRSVVDIETRTYLPSYRITRSKRVGVLFADIRNFSTVTEILRSKGRFNNLTSFLNQFCGKMAEIIGRYGRLDKFMGDGIMALFGEYCGDPHEICGRALLCAKEMCDAFEKNKEKWFADSDVTLLKFMRDNNENVGLQLGVGLNIGEVHFDYYGAPTRQEYTAISDHVNFAQRLESLASQVTEAESGLRRDPIAVSQSFFHQLSTSVGADPVSFVTTAFLDDGNRCKPTFLNVKGLGLRYPVYFLRPNDIDAHGIRRYLQK